MRLPPLCHSLAYLLLLTFLVVISISYTLHRTPNPLDKIFQPSGNTQQPWSHKPSEKQKGQDDETVPENPHPITHLIEVAEKTFTDMVASEAKTVEDAASKYRQRHGRHPPPGFGTWYTYAVSQNCTVIESFFDSIASDLGPFWSTNPVVLRKKIHVFTPRISIRNGVVDVEAGTTSAKVNTWAAMVRTLSTQPGVRLPDVDIPLNVHDQVAMLVPWETLDSARQLVRAMPLLAASDVVVECSGLDGAEELTEGYTFDPLWLGPELGQTASKLGPRPLWDLVASACGPESKARMSRVLREGEGDAYAAFLRTEVPEHGFEGYVQNWTVATDVCERPEIQGLHSMFVDPEAMNVTESLFPLFGDSGLSISNEILVPGAAEWNASTTSLPSSSSPWTSKSDTLHWRGPPNTGRDSALHWRHYQRQRLLSMLNATHVEIASALLHAGNATMMGLGYARNFRLLPTNEYDTKSRTWGHLAAWVNGWADAKFSSLGCGRDGGDSDGCAYLDQYYSLASPGDEAETHAEAKYAIAVDGDAGDDAGDLVQHLHNGQVTLRASVYRKWFDSRLVPWVHFVPLDNTFVDLYAVTEYFLGTERESEGDDHDEAARKIGEAGREWAGKTLRREDMLVYVYRLLLEYARVVDDKRERLGWVEDLTEGRSERANRS
ncbi:hypothetical protein BDW02DRAFT_496778 [Decorospora gaudefroyi]|uniref:Glycosyl transferase CAP10 domain-containing protein n=1 Tax=Decorospora gaudefroyi TaxID=184978 RepID=A0A6A5KGI1_9PLEO|nr:hypothetical protein BDW02DRAFT_496778 [Decorospora gaudefroyi]